MLKRYQVLLEDWQEQYIKNRADKFDLSFSEVIRVDICVAIIAITTTLYPKYKPGISLAKILGELRKQLGKIDIHETSIHRHLSVIYYEARKAAEYRAKQESKKK